MEYLSARCQSSQKTAAIEHEIMRRKIEQHKALQTKHSEAAFLLTRRLNQLIPVAQLPSEILAEIFYLYAIDCFYSHRNIRNGQHAEEAIKWTAVSRVCNYWRNITLSFPRLWSNIAVYNLDYLTTCISNSANTPLSIFIDDQNKPGNANGTQLLRYLATLAEHVDRIQSLHLSTKTPFSSNTLSPWDRVSAAPILTSLTLNSQPIIDRLQCIALRKFLQHTNTPLLRHLDISDDNYDWVNSCYPQTLIKLEIKYCDGDCTPYTEDSGYLSNALKIFDTLPLLQDLIIIDAFPSPSELKYELRGRTTLPNLKAINLYGWGPPIMQLYSRLVIPSEARVRLSLRYYVEEGWSEQHAQITRWIFSHLKSDTDNSPIQVILSSDLPFCDDKDITILVWTAVPNITLPSGTITWSWPSLCSLDVSISPEVIDYEAEEDEFEWDPFLSQLGSEIPLDRLDTLVIEDLESPLHLLRSISMSSRLRHIYLDSHAGLRGLLDVFGMEDGGTFPALRSLEISHLMTTKSGEEKSDGYDNLEELCNLLQKLKESGRESLSIILRAKRFQPQSRLGRIVISLKSLANSFDHKIRSSG
ncbi:hypothetical protein ABKN59_008769 [Abortiporus biennis]